MKNKKKIYHHDTVASSNKVHIHVSQVGESRAAWTRIVSKSPYTAFNKDIFHFLCEEEKKKKRKAPSLFFLHRKFTRTSWSLYSTAMAKRDFFVGCCCYTYNTYMWLELWRTYPLCSCFVWPMCNSPDGTNVLITSPRLERVELINDQSQLWSRTCSLYYIRCTVRHASKVLLFQWNGLFFLPINRLDCQRNA